MMAMKQNCPKCGTEFMGSDAIGGPCHDCAVSEMGLRERCKDMVGRMQRNAIMRQGSPVDDLTAFVVSEIGRAASSKLENSLPLCLYFDNEQDRAEFVAAVHEAKPGMISKHWPR